MSYPIFRSWMAERDADTARAPHAQQAIVTPGDGAPTHTTAAPGKMPAAGAGSGYTLLYTWLLAHLGQEAQATTLTALPPIPTGEAGQPVDLPAAPRRAVA